MPPITEGSATTASRSMNWVFGVTIPAMSRSSRARVLAGDEARERVLDDAAEVAFGRVRRVDLVGGDRRRSTRMWVWVKAE